MLPAKEGMSRQHAALMRAIGRRCVPIMTISASSAMDQSSREALVFG
jgi:hypothetical protein